MIKSIHFNQYRKLKDIDINLCKNINIISGTNGTCKSSILHIISNSFQAVKGNSTNLADKSCINVIRSINNQFNPKLETLTRGDKAFNNPARNSSGPYYKVEYYDGYSPLTFRKHNSKNEVKGFRFAVKPQYKVKVHESLPGLPVIYLGLSRLITYGEYSDDAPLNDIHKKLPIKYQTDLCKLYRDFTGYNISVSSNTSMGDLKIRADFNSDIDGIDSNTISAGEDNLYIILSALISLHYYYDSIITHNNDVDSILLIDEFDATLHPAFQYKLFNLLMDYSEKYKIQIVFTSHSLSLLAYCRKKKQNLIYLYDNTNTVVPMENPDNYKIEMYLKNSIKSDVFSEKIIPVFTEDNEARFLLGILMKYYSEKHDCFNDVSNLFYLIEANIGADILKSIFKDPKIKNFTGMFCILDGDKYNDYTNRIIALPGKSSPEKFLINYANTLYSEDSKFWTSDVVLEENIGKPYYEHCFLPQLTTINDKISQMIKNDESIKGIKREEYKKLFNTNRKFFQLLFEYWISDERNKCELDRFFKDLNVMFKQVAEINGISSAMWSI